MTPHRVNPPTCYRCGLPVEGAEWNGRSRWWHGDCYRAHVAELEPHRAPGIIGAYSHDERVQDGLEQP